MTARQLQGILDGEVTKMTPPKVAPPEPFSLERLCQEARARLLVSIEANANYELKQIRAGFLGLRRSSSHRSMLDLIYRSNLCSEIYPPDDYHFYETRHGRYLVKNSDHPIPSRSPGWEAQRHGRMIRQGMSLSPIGAGENTGRSFCGDL